MTCVEYIQGTASNYKCLGVGVGGWKSELFDYITRLNAPRISDLIPITENTRWRPIQMCRFLENLLFKSYISYSFYQCFES